MAGVLACGVIVSLTAYPASADEYTGTAAAEQVADQVAVAAPDNAQPVLGTLASGSVDVSAGLTEATVPVNSSDPIEVTTSVAGENLLAQISLPTGLELGDGVLTSNGTVVYSSEVDGGAVAVQTLEGGETRIQTVIPDATAQHEFEYGMDGFRASIDDQGNAVFIADGPEGAVIPIEAAWAVDANGASVATHYEARGDKLVQIVVPSADTAYPVVADPTWGWRNAAWGVTLNRSETAGIKDYAAAAGMCATLAKKYAGFAVACGVWASYLQVQAATANRRSPKGCLHVVVVPLPGAISHTYC